MVYIPGQLSQQQTQQTGRYVPGSLSKKKEELKEEKAPSVSTLEGLKSFAESKGIKVKEDKPGLFRRTIDIISRPLYASAGAAKALVRGDENPLMEAWKGLKGEDKETYSDVLEELGVKNKWIKGGVGFALDVALDPTTYFGGALVRGGLKGVGVAGKVGLKGFGKFNPRAVASLEAAGRSLKDAAGYAFKFGYGTTKGLSDDVARHFNKIGIAKESIIKTNYKILNKFDDRTLSEAADIMFKNKSAERLARAGQKVSFIKPKGKTANAVNAMKDVGKRIGGMTGIPEEQLYKNYIPSLWNIEKRVGGGVPRGIKVSKEAYKKEFKDLIPDDKLLKKPIEAYSRREFEVVRDAVTKKTLKNSVNAYGKPANFFKNVEQAMNNGYMPIYEKGRAGLKLFREAGEKLPKFAGIKKPLGYLKKNDFNFINNYMFPEMKSIDMLAKATGFDAFTRWFKTAVTAYFPAFHVRNYLSGNVQNYSMLGAQAFNPVNHTNALGFLKGTNKVIKFKNWTGTGADMNKILKQNFRGASRYISDLGNYIDDLGVKGFKVKKGIQKLNPRQLGNFIEMNQKAVAVSGALKQGKTIKEAIKLAEKAGFDYTKITQFESKVMRRLVPFYTFARKNAELQLRTAVKNPARILNQVKFTRGLSNIFGGKPTDKDLEGLPPWAANSLGFKVEGNRWLTKFGLPLEEFVERIERPLKTSLSSLNPLVKYPLEGKLGYDFFREQKIIDLNKISPVSGELIINKAPQWFKDIMRVKKVETDYGTKYYANPTALHRLRNLPTSRFQKTLEKLFENDKESIDKWLAFLSGARIYDIDFELQKYFKEKDLREDIQSELMKYGEGREYNIFYIPKNQ